MSLGTPLAVFSPPKEGDAFTVRARKLKGGRYEEPYAPAVEDTKSHRADPNVICIHTRYSDDSTAADHAIYIRHLPLGVWRRHLSEDTTNPPAYYGDRLHCRTLRQEEKLLLLKATEKQPYEEYLQPVASDSATAPLLPSASASTPLTRQEKKLLHWYRLQDAPSCYDYYSCPSARGAAVYRDKHRGVRGYLHFKLHYSPQELEHIVKEDRRVMLTCEKRRNFMRLLYRDQRALLHPDYSLYVEPRTVLEEHLPMFFLVRDQQQSLQRVQQEEEEEEVRRGGRRRRTTRRAPHLFTLDHTLLPYVSGTSRTVDGYVVVHSSTRGNPPPINNNNNRYTLSAVPLWGDEEEGIVIPVHYGESRYTVNPRNQEAS